MFLQSLKHGMAVNRGWLSIAEAIFGDINPGGRLPVSFPKAVGQLPDLLQPSAWRPHHLCRMDWEPLFPSVTG